MHTTGSVVARAVLYGTAVVALGVAGALYATRPPEDPNTDPVRAYLSHVSSCVFYRTVDPFLDLSNTSFEERVNGLVEIVYDDACIREADAQPLPAFVKEDLQRSVDSREP